MTSLMVSMLVFVSGVKERLTSEKGATATEYSLLVGLIALGIVLAVTAFGTALSGFFTQISATVTAW